MSVVAALFLPLVVNGEATESTNGEWSVLLQAHARPVYAGYPISEGPSVFGMEKVWRRSSGRNVGTSPLHVAGLRGSRRVHAFELPRKEISYKEWLRLK